MTNEIEAIYQKIGETVASEIDMDFHELWIYAGVTEGCSSERYFARSTDGVLHMHLLDEASDLIYDLWETSRERGDNWDEMTFHLTAEGEFEISFEYDIPEDQVHDWDRTDKWIAKHLGDVEIKYPPPPSFEDD